MKCPQECGHGTHNCVRHSWRRLGEKGSALLAVLWLSAILAAVAFSLANTVRSETERTSTQAESVRAYYLAWSGIERTLMYTQLGPGPRGPDGRARYYEQGTPRLYLEWPEGTTSVDIIPETSKFDINTIVPEDLFRLLVTLGTDPGRARDLATAILDWRSPAPGGLSMFDQFYLALRPSFRARHASLEEIEELLLVKGMTPELFYGSFIRDAQGRLQPQAGLRDCVSVYGSTGQFDINSVHPAVLASIGFPPAAIAAIVQRRYAIPFRSGAEFAPFQQTAGPGGSRVTLGGGSIFSYRSTARLRNPNGGLSDLLRTVTSVVKYHKPGVTPPTEVLRWYEN